jgi:hypothetical protein
MWWTQLAMRRINRSFSLVAGILLSRSRRRKCARGRRERESGCCQGNGGNEKKRRAREIEKRAKSGGVSIITPASYATTISTPLFYPTRNTPRAGPRIDTKPMLKGFKAHTHIWSEINCKRAPSPSHLIGGGC